VGAHSFAVRTVLPRTGIFVDDCSLTREGTCIACFPIKALLAPFRPPLMSIIITKPVCSAVFLSLGRASVILQLFLRDGQYN